MISLSWKRSIVELGVCPPVTNISCNVHGSCFFFLVIPEVTREVEGKLTVPQKVWSRVEVGHEVGETTTTQHQSKTPVPWTHRAETGWGVTTRGEWTLPPSHWEPLNLKKSTCLSEEFQKFAKNELWKCQNRVLWTRSPPEPVTQVVTVKSSPLGPSTALTFYRPGPGLESTGSTDRKSTKKGKYLRILINLYTMSFIISK